MTLARRALLRGAAPAVAVTISTRAAAAQCRLQPAAAVPLRNVEGFPVVPATVGGVAVSFVLDTGAQAHLLLPEAAARLDLPALPGSVPVLGTGGARQAPVVLLDDVRLGGVTLRRALTPVAPLPLVPSVSPPVAGLLGAPLLDRFDLDLDAPAGRLGLWEAGACEAPPDWGSRTAPIPLDARPDRSILLPVTINGTPLVALLDTGSRATLLSAAAAARLGLRVPGSANTSAGVDGAALPVGHLRVAEMRVGEDRRTDVPISVAPVQLGEADLLLGFDYWRGRRAWMSTASARLLLAVPRPVPSAR